MIRLLKVNNITSSYPLLQDTPISELIPTASSPLPPPTTHLYPTLQRWKEIVNSIFIYVHNFFKLNLLTLNCLL